MILDRIRRNDRLHRRSEVIARKFPKAPRCGGCKVRTVNGGGLCDRCLDERKKAKVTA